LHKVLDRNPVRRGEKQAFFDQRTELSAVDGVVGIVLLRIEERADGLPVTGEVWCCSRVLHYVVLPVRCLTHRLAHDYFYYHADLRDIGRSAITWVLDMRLMKFKMS
jgi:hypothetical protein